MNRMLLVLALGAGCALSACASTKAAEVQAQKEALDARHRDAQGDFDRARSNNQRDEGKQQKAPSR